MTEAETPKQFGTGEALSVYAFRGPRRLLTSRQGLIGRGNSPTPAEKVEERRQAGQSRGVRGGAGDG
jgi:hypothetical protein